MPVHLDIFLADPIITTLELPRIDRKRMRHVYFLAITDCAGDVEVLEEAFRVFNVAHPPDYRQRSLSVGDVVTIDGCRSYRCDWLGWQQLNRPLRRPPTQRALHWLDAQRHHLWQTGARMICQVRGCAPTQGECCVRCSAFIYDPDFRAAPRWLSQIADRCRTLGHNCVHRCEVCRRSIWFSEEPCCSETCFERWFPF